MTETHSAAKPPEGAKPSTGALELTPSTASQQSLPPPLRGLRSGTSRAAEQLESYRQVSHITGPATAFAAMVAFGAYLYAHSWQLLVIMLSLLAVLAVHTVAARLARQRHPGLATYTIVLALILAILIASVLIGGSLVSIALLFGMLLLAISPAVSTGVLQNLLVLFLLALAGLAALTPTLAIQRLTLPSVLPGISALDAILALAALAWLARFLWRLPRRTLQATLGSRLLLVLMSVAVAPLVLIIAIIVWQTRVEIQRNTGASFQDLAQSESQRIAAALAGEVATVRNLVKEDQIRRRLVSPMERDLGNLSTEERLEWIQTQEEAWVNQSDPALRSSVLYTLSSDTLISLISESPGHEQLLLIDQYGRLVAAGGASPDHYYYGDREWWRAAWNDGKGAIYLRSAGISAPEQPAIVEIALPAQYDSVLYGILYARFAIDELNIFSGAASRFFSQEETGELILTDSGGLVLHSSNPDRIGTQLPVQLQAEIAAEPLNWSIHTDESGERVIHGHAALIPSGEHIYLTSLQWTVIVQQPEAKALAVVTRLSRLALVSGLLVLALAVSMGGWTSRQLVRPIEDLTHTASAMAQGELGLTARVSGPAELRTLAHSFNSMTSTLRQAMEHLEQQVADRTHDLQRRAIQLQAAAEVGHAAASLRNLDRLLPQVVQLISDRFGFYHAGVFLLDEVGEYASLRAANSEGGQQMLANQYKLKVGEQGIVGYVTSTGEPRIALDVGQDAVHFRNPYLPHTRSEMALPLVSGDRLVGALDVQSTEEAAFTREDVAVLQVLADQVAMAIENARIFEELQASLREVNTLYQRYVQGAWSREELSSRYTGYEYDRSRVSPYQHSLPSEFIRRLQAGRVVTLEPTEDGEGSQRSTLIVPIMLRGQTIGSIGFEVDEPERRWTPEELALVEAVTSQVALAMENARLFEEAQVQARLEQAVRQITEEMRRAVDVESILRKTVLRLGQTIGAPRAYVRLTLPAELPPGNGQEHLPPPPGQHEEG